MSTRTRIRLATAILAAVLVWPPIQHGLARAFDLDPWAFFGWAMYATPNLRVNVRAARLAAPESDARPDWNAISVGSYGALRAFAERRGRWGDLLAPDALARELFASQPDLPGMLIRVRRWELSRETARLVPADTDYLYAPPGKRVAARD